MDIFTMLLFVLLEIVLIAIGIVCLFAPNTMWRIEHVLSVRGGEPTDFYITMTRIGGVVALAAAVILPFLPMILH
ncbi:MULTISPECIES: DUF6199 family natural product biosynthesis protein [Bifidobacterium]|uniref:DUF6199 family natural product biosynthesis protein n=1 Tax=Bifidobacterium TaxID=1678 RepID=UPI001BDD1124|nr:MULTISPECIES: DUF6199 family natural product biosynthesis protein [Bifidobacterium]MBT1160687.1 hypothetical protein [Bifidobacterium sp. SO1]MBW3077896.1 hypothetical protein [Bifidobacterium simiiventris]